MRSAGQTVSGYGASRSIDLVEEVAEQFGVVAEDGVGVMHTHTLRRQSVGQRRPTTLLTTVVHLLGTGWRDVGSWGGAT